MTTSHNLRALSDDELDELAEGWRQKAALGERGAREMAKAFDAELVRREKGSQFDPLLELPQPRPWWKFW